MEAATIPITSLSPSEGPPASKSIRAAVSLLWPYSSSNKQCALLLADPDFRLRHRKGQVRVRFTGPSAEAVANARIGIGDELLLQLRGAQWTEEQTRVATPGKSVDGELVFGGRLELQVTKKAAGEQDPVRIQVDEPTPAPEEVAKPTTNGVHSTPAKATPAWKRAGLGGADVTPIYSSPAFVKRLRLSGDHASWNPFADAETELDDDAEPRKRQRISFGGVKRWRLTDRTPSPEKDTPRSQMDILTAPANLEQALPIDNQVHNGIQEGRADHAHKAPATPPVQDSPTPTPVEHVSPIPTTMQPPALPPLHLSLETQSIQPEQATDVGGRGPTTPKLNPVPSSALPLPSPFPTDPSNVLFGTQRPITSARSTSLDVLVEVADASREAARSEQRDFEGEDDAAERMLAIVNDRPGVSQMEAPNNARQISSFESVASLASTERIVREDEPADEEANNAQPSNLSEDTSNRQPQAGEEVEYLSDTEEDEEMYYDHVRRRFPSVTESGRVRVDHQEEGYYDDLSDEDEVEEVDEEPARESNHVEESADKASAEVPKTPQPQVIVLDDDSDSDDTHEQPGQTVKSTETHSALESLAEAREEVRQESQQTLKTPAGPPPGIFSSDTAANVTPLQSKTTPQSEKDRIMEKTFSSLFGFKASPSSETTKQVQTPTPAMPIGHWSQIAKDKAEAAVVPVRESDQAVRQEQQIAKTDTGTAQSRQDGKLSTSSPPQADEPIIPAKVAVDEAGQATRETGDSLPAADIHDGSLLSAVRADETDKSVEMLTADGLATRDGRVLDQGGQLEDTAEIQELPQVNVEISNADDEAVPDGVSINHALGAAIAPDSIETPTPTAAQQRPQAEVIDLGGDSPEQDQSGEQTDLPRNRELDQGRDPVSQLDFPVHADFNQFGMPQMAQLPRHISTQTASLPGAQHSQGSVLQSDMLDTTQSTVDRSEIVTPIAEEFDPVIPDTSQDGAFEGLFSGQLQGQDFDGTAMPRFTQQTTGAVGDAYHYFSFQSDTSVATDNRDQLPSTAVQSSEEEQQQLGSVFDVLHDPMDEDEQQTVVQTNNIVQLDPALSMFEQEVKPSPEIHRDPKVQETLQDRDPAEIDQFPMCEPELSQGIPATSGEMEVDAASLPTDTATRHEQTRDVEVKQTIIESEVVDERQDLTNESDSIKEVAYPALPISSKDAQDQIDSRELATRALIESISREAHDVTQTAQNESLREDQPQIVVDEAVNIAAPPEPSSPRRTRSSQTAASETDHSPSKKTPVRRSARKARAESEEVERLQEEPHQKEAPTEASQTSPRQQSVPHDTEEDQLDTATKTSTRRSTRKAKAAAETSAREQIQQPEAKAEEAHVEALFKQPPSSSEVKTPIRRSTRKTRADSQTSQQPSEAADDTDPEEAAKSSTRQSAKTTRARTEGSQAVSADLTTISESMEDTVSVASSSKPSTRQSTRKAHAQSEETELTVPELGPPKTPSASSRKSFSSQLGRVPAVIADWFSPRRSTRQQQEQREEVEQEEQEKETNHEDEIMVKSQKTMGFRTALSYFTPLSNLEEKVYPASQYQTDNTVDVLAVITEETKNPERAKGGPRDWFTIFLVTDLSLPNRETVRVEVFRPWKANLPAAHVGDAVLLRAFAVKTRKRKPYLISTDSSAWCVWRHADSHDEKADNSKSPATRKRAGSLETWEEVRGPPVELGDEERKHVAELRRWWLGDVGKEKDGDEKSAVTTTTTARVTRSKDAGSGRSKAR